MKTLLEILLPRESLAIGQEDLSTTLNYVQRISRCAVPETEGEVVRGATPCVLVEAYKGSTERFEFVTGSNN